MPLAEKAVGPSRHARSYLCISYSGRDPQSVPRSPGFAMMRSGQYRDHDPGRPGIAESTGRVMHRASCRDDIVHEQNVPIL